MFKERLISGIVLMIITVLALMLGGEFLFAIILLISLKGLSELYQIMNLQNQTIGWLGYAASIAFDFLIYFNKQQYSLWLIVGFLMLLMFFYVFSYPRFVTEQITLVYFGFFYVSVMLSYIYQVRMHENGILLVWLIFIGAWGSDTCAYCVGVLIGKHKMAPKLSPKKSVEGGIGGVVGAGLLGVLFATVFKQYLGSIQHPQLVFALVGACASVISQIGDLAASAIKRNHNIKDYGKLIPGHGGIMDRFDSIIFTAPIVYFLTQVLI